MWNKKGVTPPSIDEYWPKDKKIKRVDKEALKARFLEYYKKEVNK